MGKINRKYLVGGAFLIVIAFILWAIVYYIDSSVTNNLNNVENEYLNDWLSNEKKEAYNEALKQYNDARSYIASASILIVILALIGFILVVISNFKGEKESNYDIAKERLDERYAKGEITKKEYEKMKKDIENK